MTQLYDLRPVWRENSRAVRSPHWQCPLLHPLHWSCNLCSSYFVDMLCLALYLAYGSLVLLPSLLAWSQTSLITADLSYCGLLAACVHCLPCSSCRNTVGLWALLIRGCLCLPRCDPQLPTCLAEQAPRAAPWQAPLAYTSHCFYLHSVEWKFVTDISRNVLP